MGDPARWFGFVTEGCFKYVTHGISDDKEHITWFSFEGEFAGDYPACLDGGPALTTVEAMVPTRIIRVSGEVQTFTSADTFSVLSGAFSWDFL